MSAEHLLLGMHFTLVFFISSMEQNSVQVIHLLMVASLSIVSSCLKNFSQEVKLSEIAEQINSLPFEKYTN